jgi:hypothetical protein
MTSIPNAALDSVCRRVSRSRAAAPADVPPSGAAVCLDELAFVLPFCLESLNVRDRKHWAKRSRDKRNLSLEVVAAIGGPRYFPRPAWRHVKVTVVRCSAGRLDRDNLYASAKSLLDCLVQLQIVEDDRSDWLDLEMKQSSAALGEGQTIVRIEHIDVRSFGGPAS